MCIKCISHVWQWTFFTVSIWMFCSHTTSLTDKRYYAVYVYTHMLPVRLGCTKSVGGICFRGLFAILHPRVRATAQGGGFHGLAHCMECVPLQRHSGTMTVPSSFLRELKDTKSFQTPQVESMKFNKRCSWRTKNLVATADTMQLHHAVIWRFSGFMAGCCWRLSSAQFELV